MIGTKLANYEITSHLGSGGMGEVYHATDTKLGRSVAIKFVPDAFSHDTERVARFQREARVLASLNHPNIAALHGLEEVDGRHFLVMELVLGETLADRISRGTIPVEEALPLARQIAEALEEAHEKGIVHRDLKPANVKITPEGQVKVLDFGLAKASEGAPTATTFASNSPTLLSAASIPGVILGTAGYMSPEQARGHDADRRSDIFSFGCVLFEMLSGRQAFHGDTVSDVIASVLKSEPDLAGLSAHLNPRIADLIRRCLAKNRRARWQAAGDLRIEIEAIIADPNDDKRHVASGDVEHRPRWKRAIPILVPALLMALTAVGVWNLRPSPQQQGVTRFPIVLPQGEALMVRGSHILDVSPDGQTIVYAANERLYIRKLSELEARPVPGTGDGAHTPMFSPDGQWVAYFAGMGIQRKLMKVALTGGAPVQVGDPNDAYGSIYGASWASGGDIFVGVGRGIMRVPSGGGKRDLAVTMAPEEMAHGPHVLPDGRTVLYTLLKNPRDGVDWDRAQIVVQSLTSGERKVLFDGGSDARYVPTGHIVYALGPTLLARPFDVAKLQVTGNPVPIVEGVRRPPAETSGAAQFSFSTSGSLAYVPAAGAPVERRKRRLHRDLRSERRRAHAAFDVWRLLREAYLDARRPTRGVQQRKAGRLKRQEHILAADGWRWARGAPDRCRAGHRPSGRRLDARRKNADLLG